MENLLTLFPAIVLLILSGIILYMIMKLFSIYTEIREPIIFHGCFIVSQLLLTFFTGSIGLFLELDQINHPLFQLNVLFLSLTYLGFGFIIQEIFRNQHSILVDYNIILLGLAPGFGFVLIMGGEFDPTVALLSQILPLASLIIFDYMILLRLNHAIPTFKEISDKDVAILMKRIFAVSMFVHTMGMIAMLAFALVFVSSSSIEVQQIWVGEWNYFDYSYFIALVGLLFLFIRMAKSMNQIVLKMNSVRLDQIINEILT